MVVPSDCCVFSLFLTNKSRYNSFYSYCSENNFVKFIQLDNFMRHLSQCRCIYRNLKVLRNQIFLNLSLKGIHKRGIAYAMYKSIYPNDDIFLLCTVLKIYLQTGTISPEKLKRNTITDIFLRYTMCGSFLAITNGSTTCRFLYMLYYKLKCSF